MERSNGDSSTKARERSGKMAFAMLVIIILLVATLGSALILFRGGSGSTYDSNVFRYGTTDVDYRTIDPAVCYETIGGQILQNVYETLVFYDRESVSSLKPMLASEMPTQENGGISVDGLTYMFNLRQGVEFSDGTFLTAEDVKYSFDRALMLNDPSGPVPNIFGQILIPDYYNSTRYPTSYFDASGNLVPSIDQSVLDQHIWAKDTYTVQFNLTTKFPAFLSALAHVGASVVSKTYVEAHGGLTKEGYDHMATNSMGTGPYKVAEVKRDNYIKLVKNDNYWRGEVKIGTVLILQVSDTAARIMALKNGDLDAAVVPRTQAASVESVEGLMVVKGKPTLNLEFIGLNQDMNLANVDTSRTNVPVDFFADRNVRLAFAHAFDHDRYIEEVMQGMALQPNGAIPKGMFGYSSDIQTYSFDLDVAKQYLNAALVPDGSGDSWLERGFNLELFYNAGVESRESACMLFKSGLEALNPGKIKITVTALDAASFIDHMSSGAMPVFFLAWAPDYIDPDNFVTPFYRSEGFYAPMIGYSNSTLDAKIAEAVIELDEDKRAEMYKTIVADMREECVYIWTAQTTNFFVGHDYIEGYYFNPMYSGLYYYDLAKKVSP